MLSTLKETWFCVFCDVEIINNVCCAVCNRYDGAMEEAEYREFNKQFPRKAGA